MFSGGTGFIFTALLSATGTAYRGLVTMAATVSAMMAGDVPQEEIKPAVTIVEPEKVPVRPVRKDTRAAKRSPTYTACDFNAIIGKKMTKALHQNLRATKWLVRLVRDEGQSLEKNNPARVTIYLNPQNVITRVVCG